VCYNVLCREDVFKNGGFASGHLGVYPHFLLVGTPHFLQFGDNGLVPKKTPSWPEALAYKEALK